jgi:hypothetical protein
MVGGNLFCLLLEKIMNVLFINLFAVLGIKLRAFHMLSNCCTTELYDQPLMNL